MVTVMDALIHLQDAALVARARRGDHQAFAELVRRYENAAHAVVAQRVNDREAALDVVQDGFVRAYCKLGQLRDLERFGAWLRTIMVREALGWLRGQYRDAHATPSPLEAAVDPPAVGRRLT